MARFDHQEPHRDPLGPLREETGDLVGDLHRSVGKSCVERERKLLVWRVRVRIAADLGWDCLISKLPPFLEEAYESAEDWERALIIWEIFAICLQYAKSSSSIQPLIRTFSKKALEICEKLLDSGDSLRAGDLFERVLAVCDGVGDDSNKPSRDYTEDFLARLQIVDKDRLKRHQKAFGDLRF